MNTHRTLGKVILAAALAGTAGSAWGDELLSGPYYFDSAASVHVKPAMLGNGWGQTLGGAWETVINNTVTTGVEVDADIPVVPYPADPSQTVQMLYGGLRLGALLGSDQVFHGWFNNTVGVGLVADQTFLLDELSLAAEANVTQGIRLFAGAGWRYTYGLNPVQGLDDNHLRGLFIDVGLRYGELGRQGKSGSQR